MDSVYVVSYPMLHCNRLLHRVMIIDVVICMDDKKYPGIRLREREYLISSAFKVCPSLFAYDSTDDEAANHFDFHMREQVRCLVGELGGYASYIFNKEEFDLPELIDAVQTTIIQRNNRND